MENSVTLLVSKHSFEGNVERDSQSTMFPREGYIIQPKCARDISLPVYFLSNSNSDVIARLALSEKPTVTL